MKPVETVEIAAGVFKDRCLALMDDVSTGRRQYVITKHGRPVARLVAPSRAAASAFGALRGMVLDQDDIVAPDFAAWGEAEE
jgi:antitoxin (DNA-binding transcriptional repressor) of toxin-antitoxin stability system